jgi:hypothetical protein
LKPVGIIFRYPSNPTKTPVMNYRIVIIIGVLALLAGSCIPSLFPLYTEKDLIEDDRVVGTWDGGENGIWIIEKLEHHPDASFLEPDWTEADEDSDTRNIHYRLTVREFHEGDTLEVRFIMHLLVLDGKMYANYFPDEYELHHDFLSWHMIEANNFSRIELGTDFMSLRFFDPSYLEQLIDQNRIKISHVRHDSGILITARTRELQKFVIKYSDEEDCLLGPDVFKRI